MFHLLVFLLLDSRNVTDMIQLYNSYDDSNRTKTKKKGVCDLDGDLGESSDSVVDQSSDSDDNWDDELPNDIMNTSSTSMVDISY